MTREEIDRAGAHILATSVHELTWADGFETDNRVLAFPTAEMRDAFYEHFKDLIEQCKELL